MERIEKKILQSRPIMLISVVISLLDILAESHRAEKIEGSPYVEVTRSNGKKEYILPMSLGEAKDFITRLLSQWIVSKQAS